MQSTAHNRALAHLLVVVSGRKDFIDDNNNNELLIINLAMVPGRSNSNSSPAASRETLCEILKPKHI